MSDAGVAMLDENLFSMMESSLLPAVHMLNIEILLSQLRRAPYHRLGLLGNG